MYAYLREHPEIFMSKIKEPMFFVYNEMNGTDPEESSLEKEPDWKDWRPIYKLNDYQRLFMDESSNSKAFGEASTAYLVYPHCAERIHRYNPKMKIIAVLRDPVERAFSNYIMYCNLGLETKTFEEVVSEELAGNRGHMPLGRHYVKLGLYSESIIEYQKWFGKNNVRVYLSSNLNENTNAVLRNVFCFLDVNPNYLPNTKIKHNVSDKRDTSNRWNRGLSALLGNSSYLKYLPVHLQKQIKGEVTASREIKRQLRSFYRDDILQLQSVTGLDLGKWL